MPFIGTKVNIALTDEKIKIIKENVTLLGVDSQVFVLNMDYKAALKKLQDQKFDLIFLDPPYRLNIVNEIIDYLLKNEMINQDAYIICHFVKGNVDKNQINALSLIKNYAYGSSEVLIYKMD